MIPIDSRTFEDPERFEDLFLSIRGGMSPITILREVEFLLSEIGGGQG